MSVGFVRMGSFYTVWPDIKYISSSSAMSFPTHDVDLPVPIMVITGCPSTVFTYSLAMQAGTATLPSCSCPCCFREGTALISIDADQSVFDVDILRCGHIYAEAV